jgi:hypothetical protein
MTPFPAIPNGDRALLSPIRFDGFDVSWAGASPHKDLFVFGSEDGRILFADLEGVVRLQPQKPHHPQRPSMGWPLFSGG